MGLVNFTILKIKLIDHEKLLFNNNLVVIYKQFGRANFFKPGM